MAHRVMPSQVVQMIDRFFPRAARNEKHAPVLATQGPYLVGILNLLEDVPDELINLSAADYADLSLAKSLIKQTLAIWRPGHLEQLPNVDEYDVVTVIRRALVKCPDEYPPSPDTEQLLFVNDHPVLRDIIRRDLGAVNRAFSNAEWKAATVLAGATIEALLLWRLKKPSPGSDAIREAVPVLVKDRKMGKPDDDLDWWHLSHFIEVAGHFKLIKSDTCIAARLAQDFRNLIHPGREVREKQPCDRATAYSAVAALEHVIRDLKKGSEAASEGAA